MADLTMRETLQPSLLDRLTDDEPGRQAESRERRIISLEKLREYVLRDLGCLLNRGQTAQVENLEDYPYVARSVLNYGAPDLSGSLVSSTSVEEIQQAVRKAIWDFEPRIIKNSVEVRAQVDSTKMNEKVLVFEIEGSLWAEPMPLRLFLKTEIDLETGNVTIEE